MKKAILLFLVITLMLGTIVPVSAKDITEPVFYIAFEQLDGGHVKNFAKNSYELFTNNLSSTEGARGVGAEIAKKGYITSPENKIGNMITGASGITVSAYIKDGEVTDGDIVTVYYNEDKAGLKLTKKGSLLTAAVSSDKNEVLKSASFDTKASFKDWTNIAVSIDFIAGKISFYLNGSHKLTQNVDFMSDSYCHYGAFLPDNIGTVGMCLDEVKIYPKALNGSELEAEFADDKNEPEETPYVDILKDNLVAHFAFDEGEGTETKSTGKVEVTGKALNDKLSWVPGIKGTAVHFHPGDPNWFNIGKDVSNALVGKNGLTVTGWFYLTYEMGSGYQNRIISLNIDGERAMFHYTMSSSQIILCALRSDPAGPLTGFNYQHQDKLTFGEWHFCVMTADLEANTLHYYLDGVELTPMQAGYPNTKFSKKAFELAEGANDDTIGGDPTNPHATYTFSGAMDEMKIYDRAITPEEAAYIYVQNKNGSWLSQDEANYDKLNPLSNSAVIMATGHNEVITAERRKRIDWDDIEAAPVLTGTTTMVPVKLLTDYLGANAQVDLEAGTAAVAGMKFTAGSIEASGYGMLNDAPFIKGNTMYVPLRPVAQKLGKSIYYHDTGLLAVGDAATVSEISKDEDYVLWLHDALTNLPYEQQTADHYGTRQVVRYEPNLRLWHSSPAILELEDGSMLVSHDTAGRGTTLWRSGDGGETWEQIWYTEYMVYAGLFENKGSVYLMGVRRGTGEPAVPAIYRSDDGGYTWTEPKDNKTGWLLEDDGTCLIQPAHTAPVPVVKHNGRIYRAIDTSGSGWKQFSVFMISADEDADLLDRKSWTITNPVKLSDYYNVLPDDFQYTDAGMCEANAVLGPDGQMYVMARFNSAPEIDYAAVCKLKDDATLEFDRIIKFPGGMTKFVVRYDESTGKWFSLVNPNHQQDYVLQRLVLSLAVSDDMYNWEVKETLLVPDWLENWERMTERNAFQYVDWYFKGDDIVYVVREANQGAANYHNGNYTTVYTLKDYKQYLD